MEHEQMKSRAWYTILRTIVNKSTGNSELSPRNSAMEGGNWACAHHNVKVSRRCGRGRGIEPCAPPWGRRRAGTAAHDREWRRDRTLGEGGILRAREIRQSGRREWPAAGADDGGGPAEEAQGACTRECRRRRRRRRRTGCGRWRGLLGLESIREAADGYDGWDQRVGVASDEPRVES
jgi:hypothetical protein